MIGKTSHDKVVTVLICQARDLDHVIEITR